MNLKNLSVWLVVALTIVVNVSGEIAKEKKKEKEEKKKSAKLPPCSACSSLVKSFENGLERTARGKFEGGDAAWEEKNQKKGYAISEVRFVEIQEKLCLDVSRGETQVHTNYVGFLRVLR